MPLRDHFHPPLKDQDDWESFHSAWANTVVRRLNSRWLPCRYRSAPQVHLGTLLEVAVDLPLQDVFEVRVYDDRRGRRLVAAIELVSPGNKDRPENRHALAIKCAAYLQQRVSLIVVDVVTDRLANLHAELMELLHLPAPEIDPEAMQLYAVAYRIAKEKEASKVELWAEQIALGAALPTLPLWLASNLAVPLELEHTYEETCQVLRIR